MYGHRSYAALCVRPTLNLAGSLLLRQTVVALRDCFIACLPGACRVAGCISVMSRSAATAGKASPPGPASAATTSTSTSTDNNAPIDLTLLLSSLSRDDLELLLVHAISRYPSLYNRLISLLSKPVDTVSLSSSLASLLSFTSSPSSLTPELEPHIEQAGDYVRCGRVRGAVDVLTSVSEAVVGWVRQLRRGKESEMDDEYRNLESLFGLLVSRSADTSIRQCQLRRWELAATEPYMTWTDDSAREAHSLHSAVSLLANRADTVYPRKVPGRRRSRRSMYRTPQPRHLPSPAHPPHEPVLCTPVPLP